MGCRPVALTLERGQSRPRTFRRRANAAPVLRVFVIALGAAARFLRDGSLSRRRQLHTRPPRLGTSDGDGLLGGTRAVFALADVVHFFAHKFPGLRAGSFSRGFVLARSFDGFLFWHKLLSIRLAPQALAHDLILRSQWRGSAALSAATPGPALCGSTALHGHKFFSSLNI